MANYFRKLIVAPEVPEHAFYELAVALRARQNSAVVLVICDLKGKRLRTEHLKTAQIAGVRQTEIHGAVPTGVLLEVCDATMGTSNWLYREQDDEARDVCIPEPAWLERVFRTGSLAWLLNIEEEPVSWNKKALYAFPGNPAAWTVEMPINARLLHVARPLEPRQCPRCGETYTSKRPDRCQCPHCAYVAMPFSSKEDAARTETSALDAFSWGKCPRCRQSMHFTHRTEQCQHCGRLLKATSRHDVELHENAESIEVAIGQLFEHVAL